MLFCFFFVLLFFFLPTVPTQTRVVGMLPVNGDGAARERVRADALLFVPIPESLNTTNAVAVFDAGLRAFTALHYQCHSLRGEILLVLDAASGCNGEVAMQVGAHRELRVLAVVRSSEEATVLEARFQHRAEVIVVANVVTDLVSAVLARTSGLGVDYIYESLASPLTVDQRKARLGCLSAHGRWCVQRQLQLDPPETRALFLRGASVSFIFSPIWVLHPMQRGRYLQIATEVMRLAAEGKLSVSNIDRFPLNKTWNAIEAAGRVDGGDGAVVIVVKK